jgi:ribulose-5-phosphate 4-epimerase/fuculose-1-phosphate aldolase
VIRFEVRHRSAPLPPAALDLLPALLAWRRTLRRLGVVGQEPERYDGLGFGNLSVRVGDGFLVTASQTSGREELRADGVVLVTGWDLARHRLESLGAERALPSSESLTHAAVYGAAPEVGAVLHGHAPTLWAEARGLGLPATAPAAAGTVAMARAVAALAERSALPTVAALAGHEDGILAWGRDLDQAGRAFEETLIGELP